MFFKPKFKITSDSLREVFDKQKQTLVEKGYLEVVGQDAFEKETERAWLNFKNHSQHIDIHQHGTIPLLLVFGGGDITSKISKIAGHTELDISHIKGQAIESTFYVLLDVEDGQAMVAKSMETALKKFQSQKRFALNIHESIALLTHYPEILKNHYLICAGSFYNKEDQDLPLLWLLDEHNNPELHYAWRDIAHGNYGAASYGIKI